MPISDHAATGRMSATGQQSRTEDPALRRARRIADYQASVRPRIAALSANAPELEDLADSFPALLFALASGYSSAAARDDAVAQILSGASLRQISDTLALPVWLRRLPPGAFTELMPQLPGDADFSLRLGSFVPSDRRRAQAWLVGVSDAYLIGGRDFALWTARNWSALIASMLPARVGLVSAWYWCSSQPGTRAHSLLAGGWDPQRSTSALLDDINTWLKRVALVEWLGNGALTPWIPDAQMGLYEFQTLRTPEDYIRAAADLDNCLEQFGARLANGVSTVARIRRGGRTIACIEVGLHDIDPTMPAIVQLRGLKNKRVPPELWRKAYDWLSHAPIEPFATDRLTPPAPDRMAARQDLWGPYIAHFEAHADPAGKVAAQRLKRTLLPRLKPCVTAERHALMPPPQGTLQQLQRVRAETLGQTADDRPPTMLQRVRDHIATLAGIPHAEHELFRWDDAVERLEVALRGRGRR